MIENMKVEFGITSDIDAISEKSKLEFSRIRDRAEYRRTQNNSTEIHE